MFHILALTPSQHLPKLWRVGDLIIGTLDTLARWPSRRRDRLQLLALDDYMLQDIGLSRGAAIEIADRPFRHS